MGARNTVGHLGEGEERRLLRAWPPAIRTPGGV